MKTSSIREIFVLFFITLAFNSRADYWTQETNFGGAVRGAASGFAIGEKCYVGIGWKFSAYYKDFWEYDPQLLAWTQKADFGGGFRLAAVGFSIGSKGYITTGNTNVGTKENDLWEFDPVLNSWTQKANFGGTARAYATGFSLDGYGYVGTGEAVSGGSNDFWRYNPVTDTWDQVASMTGFSRSTAVAFSTNGKGYVGTGYGAGAQSDFWEYDPILDTWTQKANFGGGGRSSAIAFAVCDKGYIGAGLNTASVEKKDLWEYDPILNSWTQKADLGGSTRTDAVGISNGTYGFVACGFHLIATQLNDFWKYTPDCSLLPIELGEFSAIQKDAFISVWWKTISEINNHYFTVEKSADAMEFYPVAEVAGAGYSTVPLNYEVSDHEPLKGINYYRLKQTDFNGEFSYSEIVFVNFIPGQNSSNEFIIIAPNPLMHTAEVSVLWENDEDAALELINERGDLVLRENRKLKKGLNSFTLDLTRQASGNYLFRIVTARLEYVKKIIKN
jgi:N-acetylneuraminic acid mutarotase